MTDFDLLVKDEYSVHVLDSDLYDFHSYIRENPPENFASFIEDICLWKSRKTHRNTLKDIPRLKWFVLLRVIPLDLFSLPFDECINKIDTILKRERDEYNISYKKYRLDISKMKSMDPLIYHPLSQNASNPWNVQQKNSELLDEIWKDITRTFPDHQLFSEINTRQLLQRVLFTWTRNNPEFGYKQGMNELAALLFLVNFSQKSHFVNNESTCIENESHDNSTVTLMFTKESIEADTFIMFKSMMDIFGIKYMFQSPDDTQKKEQQSQGDDFKLPIIHRCGNIYKILEYFDKELYSHLKKKHEIEPQILFLRWIRLLFSREFSSLSDSLINWELMFCNSLKNGARYSAEDLKTKISLLEKQKKNEKICCIVESIMPIVNFVAVSILVNQRELILNMDYSQTLKFLVNQPGIATDPFEIVQNGNKLSKIINGTLFYTNLNKKECLKSHGRNNFFDHRSNKYFQLKNDTITPLESSKRLQLSDSLLVVTRNLQECTRNVSDIAQMKKQVVLLCNELLEIVRLLKEIDL